MKMSYPHKTKEKALFSRQALITFLLIALGEAAEIIARQIPHKGHQGHLKRTRNITTTETKLFNIQIQHFLLHTTSTRIR